MRGDVVGADDPTFRTHLNRSLEGAGFPASYPPAACCRLKGRSSERLLLIAGVSVCRFSGGNFGDSARTR